MRCGDDGTQRTDGRHRQRWDGRHGCDGKVSKVTLVCNSLIYEKTHTRHASPQDQETGATHPLLLFVAPGPVDSMLHSYALLTTGGLEYLLAREATQGLPSGSSVDVPPSPPLPPGFAAGAAGGASPVLVMTAHPLPPEVIGHACVSAALALATRCDLSGTELESAEGVARAAAGSVQSWQQAVCTWRHHAAGPAVSYRVATLRSGAHHSFSSKALDRAVGDEVGMQQPEWRVALSHPSILVVSALVSNFLEGYLLF